MPFCVLENLCKPKKIKGDNHYKSKRWRGNTTVAVNLGVGLAREGKKVLLVDTGSQGSLTASLGYVEPDDINRTLETVMMEVMNDVEIDPTEGILYHAEGVNHIKPHCGDQKLFWDRGNWQALCKSCHDNKTLKEDINPVYTF